MRTFASQINNINIHEDKNTIFEVIRGHLLFFMLSHCSFQYVFHWQQSLACLSVTDRAIFLTYHYILILVLGFMAVLLLLQPGALLNSPLRFTILGMFFSLVLHWNTSVAFGVSGVLWATGPMIASIRQMSRDNTALSVIVATICSTLLLLGWALLGNA